MISSIIFLDILQGSGGKTPEKTAAEETKTREKSLTPPEEAVEVVEDKPFSGVLTPSRYCAIASLDEQAQDDEERWSERTSIITKFDHEEYRRYAEEFLLAIVENVVAASSSR